MVGKRLSRKQLLAEIHDERGKLLATIESATSRQLTRQGIDSAGGSIKDVFSHLIDWEERILNWYALGKSGQTPKLPDENYSWHEIRQLNAAIFRKRRRISLVNVMKAFAAVHQQTLATIGSMLDKELTTLEYYSWTGKHWTVSDYLRANTASHYRWARTKIRRYLKQLN